MKIKMKTPGRNGGEAFRVGGIIEVADKEGLGLVARGLAEVVAEDTPPATAEEKPAKDKSGGK